MTKEDFSKLPPYEQDKFIEEGGVFTEQDLVSVVDLVAYNTPCASTEVCCDSAVDITETQQIGLSEVILSSPRESSDSPQSAASLYTEGFDIQDPFELLYLVDEYVQTGRVTLHKWQIQFMIDFAKGGQSDETPFQAAVRTCNGSGKDKYIIATCVVWLCMRYKETLGVVTSASGSQLDSQTCFHIKRLCESINRKWGSVSAPIWKCNYRYYECLTTQSYIKCYATDEPGKAEGFHPIDANHKMGLFLSEDKTIPDEINIAVNKCTGYTHRVHASTPGSTYGHFYDICSTAISRKSIKDVTEVKPTDYIEYHIKASDCSHLKSNYIEQMKRDLPGGEFGPAFNSQVNAEFGTTDEMVVIPYTYIWKAKNKPLDQWIQEPHNKGGLDLSDGGDETVLVVRNGNRLLKVIPFKFDNTEDTKLFLIEKFKENGLVHPEAYIYADCGGMGKPILNDLRRKGWSNIRYCDNRNKSMWPLTYKNWGAWSWFHFCKLLTQSEIILCDDDKLIKQLSNRLYKLLGGIMHQLLSKLEMRSKGHKSPDRADAVILAFNDYKSTFVSQIEEQEKPFEEPEEEKVVGEFTLKGHSKGFSTIDYNKRYNVNNGIKDFSSVEDEIAQYNKQTRLQKV